MDPKYLGKPTTGPVSDLDTFHSPGIYRVVMTSDEVTSFCPVTGQPDYYTVTIDYVPDKLCIESKSLKLYLWHFRDQRIFAETLAVEIKNKVVQTIAPCACTVTTRQKSRGGIIIEAVANYKREAQ
jgi:7-cyano-7-deazaguanine reductase